MAISTDWTKVRPEGVGPCSQNLSTYGAWSRAKPRENCVTGAGTQCWMRWASQNNETGYDSVKLIQQKLNKAFVVYRNRGVSNVPNSLNDDGVIGSVTEAGIKFFQGRQGLDVDGVVGSNTWSVLKTF